MKGNGEIKFKFLEHIPDVLEERTLYISMSFATAAHKCCCGCGSEVITPFSPTDWRLTFDGVSVSLSPSIGNWSFPCRSHYWICHNRVEWHGRWSQESVDAGREQDQRQKREYYSEEPTPPAQMKKHRGWWQKAKDWFSQK